MNKVRSRHPKDPAAAPHPRSSAVDPKVGTSQEQVISTKILQNEIKPISELGFTEFFSAKYLCFSEIIALLHV